MRGTKILLFLFIFIFSFLFEKKLFNIKNSIYQPKYTKNRKRIRMQNCLLKGGL